MLLYQVNGDLAICRFRFLFSPAYISSADHRPAAAAHGQDSTSVSSSNNNNNMAFREGRTRGVGKLIACFEPSSSSSSRKSTT